MSNRLWTKEEITELRHIYGTLTNAQIAKIFDRSVNAIKKKAYKLNLHKTKRHIKWVGKIFNVENLFKTKEYNYLIYQQTKEQMIREAAYYRSQKNGFNSDPFQDWIMAEAEVNEFLNKLAG